MAYIYKSHISQTHVVLDQKQCTQYLYILVIFTSVLAGVLASKFFNPIFFFNSSLVKTSIALYLKFFFFSYVFYILFYSFLIFLATLAAIYTFLASLS